MVFLNFSNLFQVSVGDRELPFCNEDRDVSDTTKDYIVNRTRPTGSNNEYKKILDAFETDQIAWIWVLIFAYAAPEIVGTFIRSLRQCQLLSLKLCVIKKKRVLSKGNLIFP